MLEIISALRGWTLIVTILSGFIKMNQDMEKPVLIRGLSTYEDKDRYDRNNFLFLALLSYGICLLLAFCSALMQEIIPKKFLYLPVKVLSISIILFFVHFIILIIKKLRSYVKKVVGENISKKVSIMVGLINGMVFSSMIGISYNIKVNKEDIINICVLSFFPTLYFVAIFILTVQDRIITKYDAQLCFRRSNGKRAFIYYKTSDGYLCGYDKDANRTNTVFLLKSDDINIIEMQTVSRINEEKSIEDFKIKNKLVNMIVTKHSRQRLAERNITIREISMAISNGEIIEQYPDDYPFPSCLIRGIADNKVLHIVTSISDEIMYVITAYIPDALRWDHEFRIRKEVDL